MKTCSSVTLKNEHFPDLTLTLNHELLAYKIPSLNICRLWPLVAAVMHLSLSFYICPVLTFLNKQGENKVLSFKHVSVTFLWLFVAFSAFAELSSDPRGRHQRGGGGGAQVQTGGQAVEPDQGDGEGGGGHQGAGEPLPRVPPQHPAADGGVPRPRGPGPPAGVPTRAPGLPPSLAACPGE